MAFSLNPQILILISAAISFILSWIIFQKSRRNKIKISFALFTFFLGIWSLCFYFYFYPIIFSHLIWIKLVYFVSFLILAPAFYFILCFPIRRIKSFFWPAIIYTIFCLSLIWPLFFTNLWVEKVIVSPSGPQAVTGAGYIFYFVFIGIIALLGFYNLIKNYLSAKGILKTQLKFILLGLFSFGLPTIFVDVILPLISGNARYFWLSPVFVIFFVISTTYAISRYRLMDIRLAMSKGVVYLLSFATVICLALGLNFLNNLLIEPLALNIANPVIIILSILLFGSVFKLFEKLASKYFYYTFYSYQKVLNDLSKSLTEVLDLDRLGGLITNTLVNTMKLDRTVILLRDSQTGSYRIRKNIGFREENGISLVKDNFLTLYLEKTKEPLVYEELILAIRDIEGEEKEKLAKLQTNMKRIEANLCLPLFRKNKITGMIVLGKKVSGTPYSKEDIDLLKNLSNQASIALENARLYAEIEDLSKNLEKRVEEQVEHIEELSEMKTEFLKVVNHQLRTPVTIIKGMAAILREGLVKGKQKQDFIKKLYVSSERLSIILDDILVAQRLVGETEELSLEPCQIDKMVEDAIGHLKTQAEMKDLEILLEKPKTTIPITLVDQDMMKRALSRLVDNAILYTEKGKIEISLSVEKNKEKEFIQISIKDNGIGLDKIDKENLFKLFYRGDKATHTHTNGSGLGLFIVKNLVDAHQGKIEAKSKGRGKGTEFIITLPIITEV